MQCFGAYDCDGDQQRGEAYGTSPGVRVGNYAHHLHHFEKIEMKELEIRVFDMYGSGGASVDHHGGLDHLNKFGKNDNETKLGSGIFF